MEEAGSRQMLQRKVEIGNQKAKKSKVKHFGKKIVKRLNSLESPVEKPEDVT
jgi:hypothetical protein